MTGVVLRPRAVERDLDTSGPAGWPRGQDVARTIRPFVAADVPGVGRLHRAVFREGAAVPGRTSEGYERWLREVFVDGPYPRDRLDSLVCEDQGEIVGFLGVVPVHMRLGGRALRAACCTQFAVHPGHRGLAGVQLIRRHMSGPQDLSFSDESEEGALRLWEWAGASRIPLASLQFLRPLRPGALALSLMHERPALARVARLVGPAVTLADAVLERLPGSHFRRAEPEGTAEELTAADIEAELPALVGRRGPAITYEPGERALAWRLARVSGFAQRGPLRKTLVRDARGDALGWYVAYFPRGGTGEVLQVIAKPATAPAVLARLIHDAGRAGVVALSGRVDGALIQAYSDAYCIFSMRGPWTMVHSRDKSIVDRFHRGDAVLSRLEGEWCARFE